MSVSGLPKIAPAPPTHLHVSPEHILEFTGPLWRIFFSDTKYPNTWDSLRTYGPKEGMRFDPHPLPTGSHPGHGVMYTAADPVTPYAECFYRSRVIHRSLNGPVLTGWQPQRPLRLLDLTGNWPVVNEAAAALQMTDDKAITQVWARAMFEEFGSQIDGLHHLSSVTNKPLVTLFTRAGDPQSFPQHPSVSLALDTHAADAANQRASRALNYPVV